ncbi:MAG: hypothetical protein J6T70_16975 [Bacteroidales bacterium]|nr:hypothetical protein [Bacteroidales bacterium]
MTPVDIFNNIMQDVPKINYWIARGEQKAMKNFAKQFQFPKYYVEDLKHQISGIEYFLFYIQRQQKVDFEKKPIAICSLENNKFFIEFGYGYDIDKNKKCTIPIAVLNIYDGHFFERYKERYLHDETLQIKDVIGNFFARLTRLNLLEINDDIINDWRWKYGYFSTVFYTNEGVCLGKRSICQIPNVSLESEKVSKVVVNEYKTFVSFDMLSDRQKVAIKEEGLKYYDRYMNHLGELYEIGAMNPPF